MDRLAAALCSPPAAVALVAALVWAPATGFPSWPAMARGRYASTIAITAAVATCAFTFTERLLSLGQT